MKSYALPVRDCYAQIRSLRRIALQLIDDLGDLTMDRDASEKLRHELGEMQDAISDAEARLHGFQERLAVLSRGET